MAKLLLINSNSSVSDRIALGYIAAYARAHGHDAEVVDLARQCSPHVLREAVAQWRVDPALGRTPGLIGISAHQVTMEAAVQLAETLKRLCGARIVLGGAQVPAMPPEALSQLRAVDFLCRGEGELVTLDLLGHLDGALALEKVRGIAYRGVGDRVLTNPNPCAPENLDEYPSPYLTGVLRPTPGRLSRLLTSRGCRYRCSFCVTPGVSNGTVRFHSVDRVLEEITYLRQLGQRDYWIADPLFLSSKSRVSEILRRIIDADLDISMWFESRANLVDAGLLDLMKKAGVTRVAFGLESANQQTLDRMRKGQSIDQFTDTIRLTRSYGIGVDLLHMVGCPNDSLTSTVSNVDYVRRHGDFLDGYNAGNQYALFFGSEANGDPAAAGIVIPEDVQRADWPLYLSAGTNVRAASLTPEDKQQVLRRLINEWELAELARLIEAMGKNGLPDGEAAKLPLPTLRSLRDVSFGTQLDLNVVGGARLERVTKGPYELVRMRRVSVGNEPDIAVIRSILEQMTFSFMLQLIDSQGCLLLHRELVDSLIELLTPPVLHRGRISFTVPLSLLLNGEAEAHLSLIAMLDRFFVWHASPGLPSQRRALARLTALVDLTDAPIGVTCNDVTRAIACLTRRGIGAFPLFRFSAPDAFAHYRALCSSLAGDGQLVMVGIDENHSPECLEAYRSSPRERETLPPLYLMDSNRLLLHRKNWVPMDIGAHLVVWCESWQRKMENLRPIWATEVQC